MARPRLMWRTGIVGAQILATSAEQREANTRRAAIQAARSEPMHCDHCGKQTTAGQWDHTYDTCGACAQGLSFA